MKSALLVFILPVFLFANIANIQSSQDIAPFFPKTVEQMEQRYHQTLHEFKKNMDILLHLPKRHKSSLMERFDQTIGYTDHYIQLLSTIGLVHTDKKIADVASKLEKELSNAKREYILSHPELYTMLKDYQEKHGASLSTSDQYYLEEILQFLEKLGLSFSDQKRERLKVLNEQLEDLSDEFSKNIRQDQRSLTASREDLLGLDESFFSSLDQQDGQYILNTDYPTVFPILSNCSVSDTRKKMYDLFYHRAYPQNIAVLEKVIALRDQLAKEMGYASYAHYQLQDKLIKTPERAEKFLDDLLTFSQQKEKQEFAHISKALPKGVFLDESGKMYPHDISYVWDRYKKENIELDFEYISQFFPLERSLDGFIEIFQKFFSLQITRKPIELDWSSDLILLEIKKNKTVLGFVILDLFPRAMKFKHACMCSLVPAWKKYPAMSMVIANFPKKTESRPSLLKLDDVETLFHELGHAFHDILGRSDRILTAGTNVKRDFVELPSQIMEEWLSEPEVLKLMSSHYQTRAPLSDELIERIVQFKNCNTGYWLQRQIFYATLSLTYFSEGKEKDTHALLKQIYAKIRPHYVYDKNHHIQASFGHLMGYGATYYGYLFTKVMALDFFENIKKEGIFNPKAGKKYLENVLGQGGRKDPNQIIEDYLGRQVQIDPFLSRLGLKPN